MIILIKNNDKFWCRSKIFSSNQAYEPLLEEDEISNLQRKASIELPNLKDKERDFFEIVSAGDVTLAKLFLQENLGFNINCTNFQVNFYQVLIFI